LRGIILPPIDFASEDIRNSGDQHEISHQKVSRDRGGVRSCLFGMRALHQSDLNIGVPPGTSDFLLGGQASALEGSVTQVSGEI
jgi:hypothetical protein